MTCLNAGKRGGRDARGPGMELNNSLLTLMHRLQKPTQTIDAEIHPWMIAWQSRRWTINYRCRLTRWLYVSSCLLWLQVLRLFPLLHFLEPNVEFHLTAELLSPDACRAAIDEAMMKIVSSGEPKSFRCTLPRIVACATFLVFAMPGVNRFAR